MTKGWCSRKKCFESLVAQSKCSTRLAMGWSRSRMRARWWLSLVYKQSRFGSKPSFGILYKGHNVGLFIPDMIAFGAVVVDTKVIERITDHERGLMLNYLRITRLRVGVILNLKHRKLEWERIVL